MNPSSISQLLPDSNLTQYLLPRSLSRILENTTPCDKYEGAQYSMPPPPPQEKSRDSQEKPFTNFTQDFTSCAIDEFCIFPNDGLRSCVFPLEYIILFFLLLICLRSKAASRSSSPKMCFHRNQKTPFPEYTMMPAAAPTISALDTSLDILGLITGEI